MICGKVIRTGKGEDIDAANRAALVAAAVSLLEEMLLIAEQVEPGRAGEMRAKVRNRRTQLAKLLERC